MDVLGAIEGLAALVFGGAAFWQSRGERVDRRTDERIKLWAADPEVPFLRADVYDRDKNTTEKALDGVKEEVGKLRDYVTSDQLPKAIARHITLVGADRRIPIRESDPEE